MNFEAGEVFSIFVLAKFGIVFLLDFFIKICVGISIVYFPF